MDIHSLVTSSHAPQEINSLPRLLEAENVNIIFIDACSVFHFLLKRYAFDLFLAENGKPFYGPISAKAVIIIIVQDDTRSKNEMLKMVVFTNRAWSK